MATHTPGPWEALLDPPRMNRRKRMALVATQHGRTAIDCTGSGETYREDCANARLISAAPELLAVLNGMFAVYDWPTVGTDQSVAALISRARAAIAKAEGT